MEIIAYHLPQYHSIPENDHWWGKGFTEWINVAKARPLFRGHYQPNIPADLGFYNLSHYEDQKAQMTLAKQAGVTAFCYWHYWFGKDNLLLQKPTENLLVHPDLDLPFCFGWANETWMAKVWNNNGITKGKVLIEQKYEGEDDIIAHFNYLRPFISDKRYYRVNNRPVFVVYRPFQLPNAKHFIDSFNQLIKESGIADNFYFIAHTLNDDEIPDLLEVFDSVNIVRVGCYRFDKNLIKNIKWPLFNYKFLHKPLILKYKKLIRYFSKDIDKDERVIPSIIPSWDHTPRSKNKGVVYQGSTPELFEEHLNTVFNIVSHKTNQLVFLKSWNEWGEGNYMEPDLKNGDSYIKVLRKVLSKFI